MDGWFCQENIVTDNSGFYRTAKFRSISIDIEKFELNQQYRNRLAELKMHENHGM